MLAPNRWRAVQLSRADVRRWLACAGLFAASLVAYLTLSLSEYRRLVSPSWDLGIFDQAVRGYAHGGLPIVDIKGPGFDLLGDHFSPLLAALAPVYAVFPDARTLLVLQALLISVSVVPVTSAAWRLLGAWPGVALGAAYAFSWGFQSTVAAQFHEIALAVPLVAFSLSALVQQRYRRAALWAVPLVLVKEDLGLTVALIGLVIFLRGARRIGVALGAFGVLSFVATILVILPSINGQGWEYWSNLSATGHDGAFAGWGTKLGTLALLVVLSAGLALRSPLVLPAVPTLAWRFAGSVPFYWGHKYHYSAILMPIVFLALVDAVRATRGSARLPLRVYSRVAAPVALLVALVLLPFFPLRDLARHETYQPAARAESAAGALAAVPDGVTVETDIGLMSHLTSRTTVYFIGNPGNPAAQYLVIDEVAGGWDAPIDDPVEYAQLSHPGHRYRLVYAKDGYDVLERVR